MKEEEICSVCHVTVTRGNFYRTGYKTGRNPKEPDERVYCGLDCREFGRARPRASIPELNDYWKTDQSLVLASDHFLYGGVLSDE